ncbi:metallophosphoesterase [Pseudomonas sp. H3_H05]
MGDVHGHFKLLTAALNKLDRIFSVGDLIDRGPDSIDILNGLKSVVPCRAWQS